MMRRAIDMPCCAMCERTHRLRFVLLLPELHQSVSALHMLHVLWFEMIEATGTTLPIEGDDDPLTESYFDEMTKRPALDKPRLTFGVCYVRCSRYGVKIPITHAMNTCTRFETFRRCAYTNDTGIGSALRSGSTSTSSPRSTNGWRPTAGA